MSKAAPGQIRQFDFQADVYGARYELIENLGGNRWLCRYVEPTDEEIEAILNDPSKYAGGGIYAAPGGEYVMPKTREETALARIDRTGLTFEIRLVSREEYASYF